jgi:hypothetical protein
MSRMLRNAFEDMISLILYIPINIMHFVNISFDRTCDETEELNRFPSFTLHHKEDLC